MQTLNDVHHQFASFFKTDILQPYAYMVSKKLSEGHICLDLDEIDEAMNDLPLAFGNKRIHANKLVIEPLVATDLGNKQPFVLHNNRLYLQRYFNYESMILNRIKAFMIDEKQLEAERLVILKKHREIINKLFVQTEVNTTKIITNWQLTASITAVLNNFTIITGGPGTGKTTTVAKILAILFSVDPNLKVALAAPTGKAAARMAESLKSASLKLAADLSEKFHALEPSTIHRLLKSVSDSPYFKHHKENPLHFDVVIIDESSMIDVALFAKLLDAIGPQTRLILLGDKDQLASVEAGSLFGDLCQAQNAINRFSTSRAELINSFIDNSSHRIGQEAKCEVSITHPLIQHIVELKHSHRFSGDEGIGKFSKAIIQNNAIVIQDFFIADADEQVLIDTDYLQENFEQFVKGYSDYINESDISQALRKMNQLRILCATREGDQGLYATNKKVEKYLADKNLISLKGDFYEHRPIIITSNNYSLGLFNGDVGIIRKDDKGILRAWFENSKGELKSIVPGLISSAETVFAMTIHKSQGSEFDQVLVMLPSAGNISILTRELLYTGVTRAKHKVIIQGSEKTILQAAEGQVKRSSGISQRFIQH